MTTFEIVEGKPWHVGRMTRRLRDDNKSAFLGLGADIHRELRSAFEQSSFRKAWLADGRLIALGGVMGSLLSSVGNVWLAVAQDGARWPKALLRESATQIAGLMETHERLETRIIEDDRASYRFARRLGFHVAPPLPFLGEDRVVNMELCRDMQQNPVRRPGALDAPFIVYTAGRSRTAWLAAFLTYGEHRCHTEAAVKFRGVSEIAPFFTPSTGSAETGVAQGWRLIEHFVPNIRSVVVRRNAEDIIGSFARSEIAGIATVDEDKLRKIVAYTERCLEQISTRPGVLTVNYEDLMRPSVCKSVFEHCLPYHFDYEWWREMAKRNIQSDARAIVEAYHRNFAEVLSFKRETKRVLMTLARSGAISGFGGRSDAVH
jgi:hypothetical protein